MEVLECNIEMISAKRGCSRSVDSPLAQPQCAVPSHAVSFEEDESMMDPQHEVHHAQACSPYHHHRYESLHGAASEPSSSTPPSGSPQSVQSFLQRLIRDRHFASVQTALADAQLNTQVW